jgi:hypothetical protein
MRGTAPFIHYRFSYLIAFLIAVFLGTTSMADTIHLVGGDVLHGTLRSSDPESVTLEHPALGVVTIPRSSIDKMSADGSAAPEEAETPSAKEAPTVFKLHADDLKARPFRLEFGLDGSFGNTDEQSARLKVGYRTRTDRTMSRLGATYFYKIKNAERSDNKLVLNASRIWLKEETRWFLLAAGRFDYDEFESWETRITAQVGPGYRIRDTDKLWLAGLSGLGFRREYGSLNDDWKLEASLGTDIIWKVSERQTIEYDLVGWMVVDDPDDHRALTHLDWRISLSEESKLSLVTGFSLEYQSIVDPEKEDFDFRNYVGLSFEL